MKNNLISAQEEFLRGNVEKAKDICLEIIYKKDDPDVFNFLGVIELKNKNFIKSIKYLNQSLKINPNNTKALNNVGHLLILNQKFNLAINFLKKAISIDKNFFSPYLNISIAFQKINEVDKSIFYLEKILLIDNKNSDALNNLGKLYFDEKNYSKSLDYYKKALDNNNQNEIIHNNLGLLYERMHKFKKSQHHYESALKINPDFFDCQFNLSVLFLKIGECKKGIDLYDSRFFKTEKRNLLLRNKNALKTNADNINKDEEIYIFAEQGYGDIFQFCRFGLTLKNKGFKPIFIIYDELFNFFAEQKVFYQYLKKTDFDNSQYKNKKILPLLSLPQIFDFNSKDFITNNGYLTANSNKKDLWKNKIDNNFFNIGIAWDAKNNLDNYSRSIPLKFFLILLKHTKIKLISLHTKFQNEEIMKNKNINKRILCFEQMDKDYKFGDTAALISNLDLVISIDTAIAHLSAAMGKETWILLSHHHDWRWSLKSKNTYWYKSVKLFRSKKNNDWHDIFTNVFKKLKETI